MKKIKGIMLSEIGFANLPILLKNAGLDYFIIDTEHGGFDYKELLSLITIANLYDIEPFIRLSSNNRDDIIRYLDMGVKGLILPMTNNEEDISKVVKYAKYSPLGKRGISTTRAHTFYNPPKLTVYKELANQTTKVFAQIETVSGLNNIEKILSVEGVYGAFVGPNDLSDELNCLDDKDSKLIKDAIEKVVFVANKLSKEAGIITTNRNYLNQASLVGMSYYSVGSELSIIINGFKAVVKTIDEL